MLKDILHEILAAEKVAEEMRKDAENQAKVIALSTTGESEAIKKEFLLSQKEFLKKSEEEAEKKAESDFLSVMKAAEAEAAKVVCAAKEKLENAVTAVLDYFYNFSRE